MVLVYSRENALLNLDVVPGIFILAEMAVEHRLIALPEKNAEHCFRGFFVIGPVERESCERMSAVPEFGHPAKYCYRLHGVVIVEATEPCCRVKVKSGQAQSQANSRQENQEQDYDWGNPKEKPDQDTKRGSYTGPRACLRSNSMKRAMPRRSSEPR